MTPPAGQVRNNIDAGRFELDTPAGLAVADYRREGQTIVIYHTEVPSSLRGNGIGERLVLGALTLIRDQNQKVVPRCWFVGDVLQRHPAFQHLRAS